MGVSVGYGLAFVSAIPANAHDGHDHSRPQNSQAAEPTSSEVNESMDADVLTIPPESHESSNQSGAFDSETSIEEILPVSDANAQIRNTFNIGDSGVGEVLLILVIVTPFLLRALKHRLYS